jgi:hypothetical protein
MKQEDEVRQLVNALDRLARATYGSTYDSDPCIKCGRDVMCHDCQCELSEPRSEALTVLKLKTAKDIFRAERARYFAEEKRELARRMKEEGFEFGGES